MLGMRYPNEKLGKAAEQQAILKQQIKQNELLKQQNELLKQQNDNIVYNNYNKTYNKVNEVKIEEKPKEESQLKKDLAKIREVVDTLKLIHS